MAPAGGMNAAPTIHPTLSTIWPAVAVAEREVFEMLGIPFAGNALEPLLLDEAFVGHPLRRGYAAPAPEPYIHKLLEQRHAAGVIEALRLAGGTGASPVAIQASSPSAPARAPQQSVPSSATGEGARATDAGEGTP